MNGGQREECADETEQPADRNDHLMARLFALAEAIEQKWRSHRRAGGPTA